MFYLCRGQDSVDSTVARLRLSKRRIVLDSRQEQLCFPPPKCLDPGTGDFLQGIKRQGREADHLPLFIAEYGMQICSCRLV